MNKTTQFPKGPIITVKGKCISVEGDDIDTDRIIPARFLKCINFENLGDQVFADDRKEKEGLHPFDLEINQGASILLVKRNFGCGSSREHAPQALMRWGIKAIVGISFAEIFYGNCLTLGIPCAKLSNKDMILLEDSVQKNKNVFFEIDVNSQTIRSNDEQWHFSMEKGSAEMLTSGEWDATSTLIAEKDRINKIIAKLPYLNNFKTQS